jgi:hypothetical protein|tara:strand:- start:3626 stop:5053 length:1428 start_codon:yes stop_codon:yes gene_type:complete
MFKQWCREQGFSNGSNLSHVLMDGGVLSVPFDRLNTFYEKYIEAYNNGEKIYVVEQKTDNYNFFVDLDYKDEDEMSFSDLESVCKVICDKVKKFGGKEALISVAEPKPIGHLIKTGVHINWPGFVVNRSSAIAIREHVINTLNLVYGSKDWSDIVDASVYGSSERKTKGSGFRMPWSHKKGKHEACSGQGCTKCNNTGKETQSEYKPIFIYRFGPFSMLEAIEGNTANVKIMHMATLRTERDDPVVIESSYTKKQEGTFTTAEIKNEFKDQEAIGLIEEFVRKNLEGQGMAKITKIYESKKHFLVSTNSHYCENKKCNHNSNHVWFHIIGDTIAQKCFSNTDILRHFGFCKDFTGKRHQLSPKIKKALYKEGKIEKYIQKLPKQVETVTKTYENDIKTLLNKFILKNIFELQTECKIEKIDKKKGTKKYLVHTNYTCPECKESDVKFEIVKKVLEQKCKCDCRKHLLTDKIATKL